MIVMIFDRHYPIQSNGNTSFFFSYINYYSCPIQRFFVFQNEMTRKLFDFEYIIFDNISTKQTLKPCSFKKRKRKRNYSIRIESVGEVIVIFVELLFYNVNTNYVFYRISIFNLDLK